MPPFSALSAPSAAAPGAESSERSCSGLLIACCPLVSFLALGATQQFRRDVFVSFFSYLPRSRVPGIALRRCLLLVFSLLFTSGLCNAAKTFPLVLRQGAVDGPNDRPAGFAAPPLTKASIYSHGFGRRDAWFGRARETRIHGTENGTSCRYLQITKLLPEFDRFLRARL